MTRRTVALRDHVAALDPEGARGFARSVASRMPRLELDYVRLNVRARRGRGRGAAATPTGRR